MQLSRLITVSFESTHIKFYFLNLPVTQRNIMCQLKVIASILFWVFDRHFQHVWLVEAMRRYWNVIFALVLYQLWSDDREIAGNININETRCSLNVFLLTLCMKFLHTSLLKSEAYKTWSASWGCVIELSESKIFCLSNLVDFTNNNEMFSPRAAIFIQIISENGDFQFVYKMLCFCRRSASTSWYAGCKILRERDVIHPPNKCLDWKFQFLHSCFCRSLDEKSHWFWKLSI